MQSGGKKLPQRPHLGTLDEEDGGKKMLELQLELEQEQEQEQGQGQGQEQEQELEQELR